MDLYTLNSEFIRQDVIDKFTSVVWTERYSTSGEVVLEAEATSTMITNLAEGTFLGLEGSKEIMLLETQSIEKGKLKVEGKTLLEFLKERLVRVLVNHNEKNWFLVTMAPGTMLGHIVQEMVIDGVTGEDVNTIGFDGSRQVIPNLTLGAIDGTGATQSILVPYGTVYDALTSIAQDEIGMSLYLHSADSGGYSLKFKAYRGLDRTSDQDDREVVRFSPTMDSLTNIKELRSITGYKNVAYAFASSEEVIFPPGIAYADPASELSTGFDRRTLMIFVDDIRLEDVGGSEISLAAVLDMRARDALANNNFTRVVDGEVVPQSQFQYGTHYGIGDIVELEGHSGFVQKARITEYIRTQDNTGERAYPTVSVID